MVVGKMSRRYWEDVLAIKRFLENYCNSLLGIFSVAYCTFIEYALQTQEHAEKALKYLSMPLLGKEQPEKQETLETALLSTYLLGKSNLAMRKFVN